jgi:hypothetical protein
MLSLWYGILRILPDKDDDNYQEISDSSDEHYDYCTEDINPHPPQGKYNSQTFPRRRKILFSILDFLILPCH